MRGIEFLIIRDGDTRVTLNLKQHRAAGGAGESAGTPLVDDAHPTRCVPVVHANTDTDKDA